MHPLVLLVGAAALVVAAIMAPEKSEAEAEAKPKKAKAKPKAVETPKPVVVNVNVQGTQHEQSNEGNTSGDLGSVDGGNTEADVDESSDSLDDDDGETDGGGNA